LQLRKTSRLRLPECFCDASLMASSFPNCGSIHAAAIHVKIYRKFAAMG
jgi:hypothetical protein